MAYGKRRRTARRVSPWTLGNAAGCSANRATASATAPSNSAPRPGRRSSYHRCDSSASASASGRKETVRFTCRPGACGVPQPRESPKPGSRHGRPSAGPARPPVPRSRQAPHRARHRSNCPTTPWRVRPARRLEVWVYPGFPTLFWGLSGFFVNDLMGKALWSSWKTRSVFQGAVGAFCASTAPSASTGPICMRQDRRVLGLQSTRE